jgi:transcriptional antiterminator NusG
MDEERDDLMAEDAAEEQAAESEEQAAAQAEVPARQEDAEGEAEVAPEDEAPMAAEDPDDEDQAVEMPAEDSGDEERAPADEDEAAPQMTIAEEQDIDEAEEAEAPETALYAGEPADSQEADTRAVDAAAMQMAAQAEDADSGVTPPAEAEEIDLVEEPDDGRAWYVVHCYSGYENKVRHNLEQRIETMGMKDQIFDVVVPTEEEIEVKEGKRRTVERRVFPGYILVNMIMGEEPWYVVRNTPGVTSFVGQGNEPLPLRPEEVSQIIKRMEADAPRIKVTFRAGERVRIVDGPFNDFRGTVSEIDMERAKVRVMVNFFGRETPVELDFLQVEKA